LLASAAVLAAIVVSCRQPPAANGTAPVPGGGRVVLPGVDTSSLTVPEQQLWSELVTELTAPCAGGSLTVARCVVGRPDCARCLPAAELLVRQVKAGNPKAEIAEVYADRFAPDHVKTIVIGDSPTLGPADAPVTVVEFADYQCPACGIAAGLLANVLAGFEGRARLVFKHFPWPYHQHAALAAQAAVAAERQGQFWPMHRRLFADQQKLGEPDLLATAQSLGLDLERFRAELGSESARQRVAQDQRQGESLGVAATPTIFINGRECDLSKFDDPEGEMREWIEVEIALGAGGAGTREHAGPRPAGTETLR
jgi:protein-disulfide isomerase